jgi:hypothetical protein
MIRSLLALVAAGTLVAAAGAEDAKPVKIVHVTTGKVLAVADDSAEAGARAVLAKDDNSDGQQWTFEKDGSFYKLVNKKSGKVLDVFEESKDEGGQIIVWDDKPEGYDNQRWAWQGEGKERRLKSKSSELVLDVDDEGRVIQKKADEKAKAQLWKVVEVEKK